jgi:hypothetical protein
MEVKRKMAKETKKLLFIAVILSLLFISSTYAALIPNVHAAEITAQQKGLAVLSNVVGVDLTKYDVTTEENSQYPPYLGAVLQENVLYTLTSANSKLKAFCTFANGDLQAIYVLEKEGTPSLTKPAVSVNAVERAQGFLSNYQAYAAKPIFGQLISTLNGIDASKNQTTTIGDKVLEVTAYGDRTHFKWYYTANGAIAPYSKVVAIGFKDGFLTSFIDNWNLYSIGSTSVNLSKEEAVAIALDTARKHSWTMQLDEDNLDPRNFNEKRSVSWTALVFDGSLDANKTRSEDVLELYPVWRVGLVLNRVYGELYGIEVDIWADTKEVRSVREEYSELAARWFENSTANVGTSAAFVNGAEPNFVVAIMFSATTVSIIGAFAAVLFKKKPRALHQLKPRFLKTCGVLLGSLILLVVFLPLVATANATTRAGNIWGARSSGAPNNPYSYSWRKTDWEISRQWEVTSYIASNFFTAANGYTGFSNEGVNKDVILYQAEYFSNNYDYVAIVDWDHGVGGYPGQAPGYDIDEDEMHYMFEDDWGTVVGTPTSHYQDWSHGVYDIDIYNAFPPAKVHFAFIDACFSANLYYLGQGFHPESGEPLGLPFAFTHRKVTYVPAGYTGTEMSDDGYNRPDAFPQCYIGFPTGSAALGQNIPYDPPGPQWYQWIIFFFYFALDFDISVKDALDMASYQQWQCNGFLDSPLTGSGFTAVWPMDTDGDGEFEVGPDQLGYHSTLAVYGNGNIHLRNFQPSHMVTWPSVSGPTTGDVGVSYQFSAYSIDSQGHNIQYRFDWGDGSPYTETGWYSNGATAYRSHSWGSAGVYSVRVQARCPNSGWSSWSSPYTITIGTVPQLTVLAYNQYGQSGYVPLYIDGQYVGTTGYTYTVTPGNHQIYVASPLYDGYGYHVFQYYYYDGNYDYNNPTTLSVTAPKTVTAYYYSYYW